MLGRTLITWLMIQSAACSSGNSVDVGDQRAAAVPPVQGELRFVDSSGKKAETVYEMAGANIDLPIQVSTGQIGEYSVGFTDKHPQVQLQSGRVVLRSPPAGIYHVAVVARHRQKCNDSRLGQCQIDNQQITKVYPQVDLQTSVVIRIVNQSDLTPTGVGQGGGFMGQILRGEGLIGSLAKMFMGGGGAGGILGGLGGGQAGQSTSPSTQPSSQPTLTR